MFSPSAVCWRGTGWPATSVGLVTVSCADRPGLLSSISRVLLKHDLNLNDARVTTLGARAEDVFVVNGGAVEADAPRAALIQELQQEFCKRTADEWAEEIRAAGVPCGPVNTLANVFTDEHVLASGMLQDLDHPSAGPLKMLASPVLIDGERMPIRRPPPTLDQHTEEAHDDWS